MLTSLMSSLVALLNSTEILACAQADIMVMLPNPMTSGAKSEGRFGKQDFVCLPTEDVTAARRVKSSAIIIRTEDGKTLRRYWTTACLGYLLKSQCPTGPARRIRRWEHEPVLEAVQQRLDKNLQAMPTPRDG